MFLSHIKLANFKNYADNEFDFCEKVNAVVGENGAGKTNLLDAIHYLSFCKSYFISHDKLSVKFEEDFFAIHGEFVEYETRKATPVSCTFKASTARKTMKANQKEYNLLSEHIGLFPLIMISPYDKDIINDGSEVRRRFFDIFISQFDKEYLRHLIRYQKLIGQRNNLLKQFAEQRNFDRSLLQVFDDQLLIPANYIFAKRKEYIEQALPYFQHYYNLLSGKEEVQITYESGLLTQSFEDGMLQCEMADRKSGYTNFGIHKDDYLFMLNGRPIKRYGSQGQQKSFAIALKLSQFDYIHEKNNVKPILLLDDIFDKLDMKRTAHLLELVGQEKIGQVFISETNENRVKEILNEHHITHNIYTIG